MPAPALRWAAGALGRAGFDDVADVVVGAPLAAPGVPEPASAEPFEGEAVAVEVGRGALDVDRVHIVAEHRHPAASLDHHLLLHLRLASACAGSVQAVQLLTAQPHYHRPGHVLVGRCRRAVGHTLHVQRQLVGVVLRNPVAHRALRRIRGREIPVIEQVVALGQQQQPVLDALHAGPVDAPVLAAVSVDLGDVVHRVRDRRGSLDCSVPLAHGSLGSTLRCSVFATEICRETRHIEAIPVQICGELATGLLTDRSGHDLAHRPASSHATHGLPARSIDTRLCSTRVTAVGPPGESPHAWQTRGAPA